MFKPTHVASKSWWVPSAYQIPLAVPLDSPDQYLEAIRGKVNRLLAGRSPEELGRILEDYLGPETGLVNPANRGEVLESILGHPRVLEMVKAGSPDEADVAEQPLAAIRDQDGLDLEGFLGELPV